MVGSASPVQRERSARALSTAASSSSRRSSSSASACRPDNVCAGRALPAATAAGVVRTTRSSPPRTRSSAASRFCAKASVIQAVAVSTSTVRASSTTLASATAMSASARVRWARRLAGLGMSCEIPTRTQVKSSRDGWNASGPDIGKLSIPSDSLGSGSAPAAPRAARLASTPSALARRDGAFDCARAIAASKVSGSARACDAKIMVESSATPSKAVPVVLLATDGTAAAA